MPPGALEAWLVAGGTGAPGAGGEGLAGAWPASEWHPPSDTQPRAPSRLLNLHRITSLKLFSVLIRSGQKEKTLEVK